MQPYRENVSSKRLVRLVSVIVILVATVFLAGLLLTGRSQDQITIEPKLQRNTTTAAADRNIPLIKEMDNFVAIGDTGSGLAGQKAVAAEMFRQYEKKPFPLVLILGDLIYPTGDVAMYGKSRFLVPYAPLLEAGVQFMVALGNHDVLEDHQKASMAFFKMPAAYYDFTAGDVHFFALNTNNFDDAQRRWLISRLSSSQSRWRIVFGHHPVFSSGQHGSSQHLIKTLKPVLEKYGAHAYLSGHDHNYERFAPVNGVAYIVSGGGGASLRKFAKVVPDSLVRQSVYHFLRVSVSADALDIEAIDSKGRVFDKTRISQREQVRQKPAA